MVNIDGAAVGLDAGGTNIRAGVIGVMAGASDYTPLQIGEIVSDKSPSILTLDESIRVFINQINNVRSSAEKEGYKIKTAGIGIPDPFDYEKGVSLMKHKFQSLYGVNLKEIFEQKLGMPVFFLGDAQAFGLGVYWAEHSDKKRLLTITIGTGLGAGFIVDGRIGKDEDNIPPNGQIWNLQYKNGILEDLVSKKAIEKSYKEKSGENAEVKTISELARNGNMPAKESFDLLALDIGEVLANSIIKFRPEIIVFGGKIGANAFDLFGRQAEEVFREKSGLSVPFVPTTNEYLAIYGAAYYALGKEKGE